jgi:hypothetical protein
MAIHYYGTQASAFEAYVTKFHDLFGITIWVTEFACQVSIEPNSTSISLINVIITRTSLVKAVNAAKTMSGALWRESLHG